MSTDESKVEEVFFCALDMGSVEELTAYLDEACKGDELLRSRVQRLLDAKPKLGSFLQGDAGDIVATIDQPIAEKPGAEIGPYKLLQQIGEGGMGVVYMAEQTELIERRVALKIIKPGMDTRQVIARFEAERQALAMMDHPNIAKAFDAGVTDSGRPYFVMELVKGVPITTYCDERHLTPRERLELFVPICQAVQHAHQKGIIHRDIKPSNVLVADYDDHPVPKVIDFGVAKAIDHRLTEKTMFTEFGQVLGTFEYMSPEQAKLNQWDVDTRSDIYSLGVLLYELLSGETPFDSQRLRHAALDEILRVIREEAPIRPSKRLTSSESLPSIAANRQIEPRQLSALVRGELDWIVMKSLEKDRTRRYETASKLAEDIGRYLNDEPVEACPPTAAYRLGKFARRNKSLLATMTVVASALLIGTALALWQASEAQSQRALALQKAREAQLEVEKTGAVANLLEEMLSTADPGDTTLKEVMNAFSVNLDDRLADQPEVEIELRRILGHAYSGLGRVREAKKQLTQALELQRTTRSHDSLETARILRSIVWTEWLTSHDTDSTEFLEKIIEISRQHEDRGLELEALSDQVRMLTYQGRLEAAREAARKGLQFISTHELSVPFEMFSLTSRLADLERSLGNRPEAERLIERAATILEQSGVTWKPISYWWFYLNRGETLFSQGDFVGAGRDFRKSLDIARKGYTEDNHRVRTSKFGLMEALEAQSDNVSGTELESLLATFPESQVARTALYKARWALIRHRDVERALELTRRALSIEEDGRLVSSMARWAAMNPYSVFRHSGAAIQFADLAIEAEPDVADYWTTLGIAKYKARDFLGATEAIEKAIIIRGETNGIDAFVLAMSSWHLGNQDEARKWYHQALGWTESNEPDDDQLQALRTESAELLQIEKPNATASTEDE